MQTTIQSEGTGYVQLEIPAHKLEELFNLGLLCAAELRCLNRSSKEIVKNICKYSCAKRMHCLIDNQQCCFVQSPLPPVEKIVIKSSKLNF